MKPQTFLTTGMDEPKWPKTFILNFSLDQTQYSFAFLF